MKKYAVIAINNHNNPFVKKCNNEQHAKNYQKFLVDYKWHEIVEYEQDKDLAEKVDKMMAWAKALPRVYRNRIARFGRCYAL